MSGKKKFLVDVSLCCGCYNCQLSCKDEHVDNDWRPYAAPQPNIGQFWLKMHDFECGTLPKVRLHYIPVMCAHCENAACINACGENAIVKRSDGLVIIDPERCTGCGKCAAACPIDAIYMNSTLSIAQKCTGCAHLLDNGRAEPRCVGVCPTGALKFVDEDEIPEEAVSFVPEEAGSSAYYINIPGKFVAGAVVDMKKHMAIEGAVCTLTINGRKFETQTDAFGDFWLENVPEEAGQLQIQAEGYAPKELMVASGSDSVNVGDIDISE